MTGILNRNLFKKCVQWPYYFAKRNEHPELHYDLSQEICVTYYKKVLIVGINLPDASNSLNDSALIKLNESLKDFNANDQYSVAVLHGIGGNFCTGIQGSANIENAKELIQTMKELKKPTVCSLTGVTKFFGFQLGIMCDMRMMECNAIFGLGYKKDRGYLFPIVRERLTQITGLTTALGIAVANAPLNQADCLAAGLINNWVEVGAGLGKCINYATTIAKFPLEDIIEERSLIYSCVEKYRK